MENGAQGEAKTKDSKNCLSFKDRLALAEWVQGPGREVIEKHGGRSIEAQAAAAAALRFPVTPANVAGVAQELGIGRKKAAAPPTVEERLAWCEKTIMDIARVVTQPIGTVDDMMTIPCLNDQVRQDMTEFWGGAGKS